ncbi:MerR family transcriptional regulator [Virgibacillus proomii]|uniref:MerR family transcriptional regulator n=1 Tax=Virgibacillus proomii TaxID=84407 RepID=UPI001C10321E|nr:MerR family DNA-binding transcriptional regulator [Virgibacillus proomii]MBU5267082.1 MerR family DNA-binding transcriptional regulator [Virgibacillus proomii]
MRKTEITFAIQEIAERFGVTTRTIRYYEEIGILQPRRTNGGQRVFTKKEIAQLQLIFRGKKFGFSLEEIREMIRLFDEDPTGKQQLKRTIEYGYRKVEEVAERINELEEVRAEMEKYIITFQKKLAELEGNGIK